VKGGRRLSLGCRGSRAGGGCDLAGGGEIPPAWYGGSWDELEALVERLIARKAIVRELILAFRGSPRRPFPEWGMRRERGRWLRR